MKERRVSVKDKDERIIVLAVDIDNDLYRKTKISGPLIGRVQNLSGASQLALADPEDTDSNNMFEAVKIFDELKEDGYTVNIATITGSEIEGYHADREISRQLELVLDRYKADSCIFVTDGASDKRVLPIIESRVKIGSVKIVTVKQAETLENTYFTVLEKLKEPHYARIIFGIPAILLLLFAISYAIGTGWQLPVAFIGFYLFIKGFGLEEGLLDSFRGFGFSIDSMSFVFYLCSIIFLATSIFIGFGNYSSQLQITGNQDLALEYGIEGFLLLFPAVLLLYLIGRIIDVRSKRYLFRIFKYGVYIGSSIILWVLLYSFDQWIIGQIYFGQFLYFATIAVIIGIAVSTLAGILRRRVLRSKKIKGKLVVNELGALMGKVGGLDLRRGMFIINTSFGNPISYSIDRIVEISDKVVIK